MNTVKQYTFKPDYSVHPGEILGETLKARSISQSELASRCGISEKHVSQIITGKASVTSETALLFERALGIRASLWINLESSHRLHLARRAEEARFTSFYDWAKEFPLRSLTQRGWIPSTSSKEEKVGALLEFFGVSSPLHRGCELANSKRPTLILILLTRRTSVALSTRFAISHALILLNSNPA
jgi:addiction module HigA family antidote